MSTQSSILAWRIPCTGKPGGLQSMVSQKCQTQLKQLSMKASASEFKYRISHFNTPSQCTLLSNAFSFPRAIPSQGPQRGPYGEQTTLVCNTLFHIMFFVRVIPANFLSQGFPPSESQRKLQVFQISCQLIIISVPCWQSFFS